MEQEIHLLLVLLKEIQEELELTVFLNIILLQAEVVLVLQDQMALLLVHLRDLEMLDQVE